MPLLIYNLLYILTKYQPHLAHPLLANPYFHYPYPLPNPEAYPIAETASIITHLIYTT